MGCVERARYRVLVLSAEAPSPETSSGDVDPPGDRTPTDSGWELVRSRVTKDGVSRLLVYRKSA